MSLSKKYTCGCGYWRRSAGKCKNCGKPLKHSGWVYTWREGGRVRTATAATRAEAVQEQAKKLTKKGRPVGLWTVEELTREYLERVSSGHAGEKREQGICAHLNAAFGSLLLAQVEKRDVEDYITSRQAAPATVKKEVGLFKTVWKWAQSHGLVEHDPFAGVKPPAVPVRPMRPITKEQEEQLFNALPVSSRHYYLFLVLTGCRKKEAINLMWSDVDLPGKVCWVWSAKTGKGKQRQPVHLSEKAVELLKNIPQAHDHVFVSRRGEPFVDPSQLLRLKAKELGIPIGGVHDLRHLFVSRLVQAGVDTVTVAKLSRHKTLQMVDRYSHLAPDHLRDALEKSQK